MDVSSSEIKEDGVRYEQSGNESENGLLRGDDDDDAMEQDDQNNDSDVDDNNNNDDDGNDESDGNNASAEDTPLEPLSYSRTSNGAVSSLAPLQIPDNYSDNNSASSASLTSVSSSNVYIPSLRGTLSREEGSGKVSCKGLWALSDDMHEVPGQTGVFEFHLLEAFESNVFPPSGKHTGWFFMKQQGKGSVKIPDLDLTLRYTKIEGEADCYSVDGAGQNKFGTYTLRGKLNSDMSMQMYREYASKPIPVLAGKKGSSNNSSSSSSNSISDSTSKNNSTELISPRESSNRIRKASSYIKDYETTVTPSTTSPRAKVANASTLGKSKSSKSSLPPYMVKCQDLLKDVTKLGSSVYFLKPVDHVLLGIPDYPLIITRPMDYQTVRENLESGKFHSPEEFADDMRLIFKNAITYNKPADHAVHIAAREVYKIFEDKFRVILSAYHSQNNQYIYESAPAPENPNPAYATRPKNANSFSQVKNSQAAAPPSKSTAVQSKSAALSKALSPRPISKASTPRESSIAPKKQEKAAKNASSNSNNQNSDELFRKMKEMESQLEFLRSQLQQKNEPVYVAEPKPKLKDLTNQEKFSLIQKIQNLSPDKMPAIIEIIKTSAHDMVQGNDEEIQIPIDSLDTATLRKLEAFVNGNDGSATSGLKRSASFDGSTAKKSRGRDPNKPVKERKPRVKKLSGVTSMSEGVAQSNLSHNLLPEDDSMLFEFDEDEEFS